MRPDGDGRTPSTHTHPPHCLTTTAAEMAQDSKATKDELVGAAAAGAAAGKGSKSVCLFHLLCWVGLRCDAASVLLC